MSPRIIGLGCSLACAAVATAYYWPGGDAPSDNLAGRWRAVNPSNPALHGRGEGVRFEEVLINRDGTLLYRLGLKDRSTIETESGWSVVHGRLVIKSLHEPNRRKCIARFKFNVSGGDLSLQRKGFPRKEFKRSTETSIRPRTAGAIPECPPNPPKVTPVSP